MLQINLISKRSPVAQTSKLVYRLLMHICNGNRQNQFHAAQWVDLFVKQVCMLSQWVPACLCGFSLVPCCCHHDGACMCFGVRCAQSCTTDIRNDLHAEAMLTTLLSGNRELLEHAISPSTISRCAVVFMRVFVLVMCLFLYFVPFLLYACRFVDGGDCVLDGW